jgi:hypothetical protein
MCLIYAGSECPKLSYQIRYFIEIGYNKLQNG